MKLFGRELEQSLIEATLLAGHHILLEGPVGVGKTTLALAVAEKLMKPVVRVDGDGRYTEQKLVGSFDPKLVLDQGFSRASFIPGPLYQAMEEGSIFLINELNRMPEMVQNVLLPALDEGKIQLPVLGELKAAPGFAVIATQNPREFVGTSALSEALLDRLEWISISALTELDEVQIVKSHLPEDLGTGVVESIVELMRLTRSHAKIKRGASIRAAISMAQILKTSAEADFWKVAKLVLANRVELEVGKFSNRPYSDLLDELLEDLKTQLKKKP